MIMKLKQTFRCDFKIRHPAMFVKSALVQAIEYQLCCCLALSKVVQIWVVLSCSMCTDVNILTFKTQSIDLLVY